MIGTEFLQGQGLGNRLFAYITARSIAADKGCVFGTAGQELLQADFLELDKGLKITDTAAFTRYDEKEERLYLPTSAHDMVHGIFVAGADENLHAIKDDTLIYGNLQDESYFAAHKEEIRSWLRVKQDCESYTYTRDNLCILNMRGGEYTDKPELFLRRKYWTDAMARMRERVPDMQFVIVTDDVPAAKRLFPKMEALHKSAAFDYVTVKNARYLIVSNSSFAFFPAYTSETVRFVIAPKYWARHNVSGGFWASPQNIYDEFTYLDRKGQLFTAEQCREELAKYSLPSTKPWKEEDPDVRAVEARNRRRYLIDRAQLKIRRKLGIL